MPKFYVTLPWLFCALTAQASIYPYLQNPQPTQMTVMWTSTNHQQAGWVEYGQNDLDQVARESYQGLFMAFTDVNRVTLKGLQPGTTYKYRVAVANIVGEVRNTSLTYGDTIYSDVYQFTTPKAQTDEVSCLVFDDLHGSDTLMGAVMRNNGIDPLQQDFVFFNGDILNAVPSHEAIVEHMLTPYSELFAHQVPFLYTRGNHEYRNKYARELDRYVTTPGTKEGHPFYYTFTWGSCFFIVLDAGEDKPDNNIEYRGLLDSDTYRAEEAKWLEQQLKTKACRQAAFRIVLMHVPFETSSSWDYSMKEINRLFLPLLNKHKVDLAIHGHCHRVALKPANNEHHFPLIIGGGKRLTDTPSESLPAVVQLHVKGKQLDVNVWNYNKENKASITLTK